MSAPPDVKFSDAQVEAFRADGFIAIDRITDDADHAPDVSLAVLSHGNRSQAGGIETVEKVASLTRRYLNY